MAEEEAPQGQSTTPLVLPPGFDRDSTYLSSDNWTDGQAVRFSKGRPRKMGGHRSRSASLTGPIRELKLHWHENLGYLHSFGYDRIERLTITRAGVVSAITNRTPASFASNSANNWQHDVLFDEASSTNMLISHCSESLTDIDSGTDRPIYYGDIEGTAALTPVGKSIGGGIVALQPYLMAFGHNGEVAWTDASQPTDWASGDAGSDRITQACIVRGMKYRGSGNSIAGLLWSQDALIKAQYVGGDNVFDFQHLASELTILSSRGVIEYNGRFYWPGVDTFYVFDGTVRELPCDTHHNWFFDNLNYDQRQKIWAVAVPRWGEIWWFHPRGSSTECTHALIFNIRETLRSQRPVWYDTELARSAGTRPADFRYPLWADPEAAANLYQHELGVDSINVSGTSSAINSYIETNTMAWHSAEGPRKGSDNWVYVDRVEPDMVRQVGDMTVRVTGRDHARDSDVNEDFTLTSADNKINMDEQRRLMRLRFTSNAVLGDYEFGKILLSVGQGSGQ